MTELRFIIPLEWMRCLNELISSHAWFSHLCNLNLKVAPLTFIFVRSRFVNRKWPMWFTPNCISTPSLVKLWGHLITPALFTKIFSWSSSTRDHLTKVTSLPHIVVFLFLAYSNSPLLILAANSCTDSWDDRSHVLQTTCWFFVSMTISLLAV